MMDLIVFADSTDLLAEMDELLESDTTALDRVDVAVERVTASVFLPVFLTGVI